MIIKYIKNRIYKYRKDREKNIYLRKHGSTHCCPKCKKWEHEGNLIYTEIYDDWTDKRTCSSCGYIWRSFFCPAGHYYLEQYVWDGEKFVEEVEIE